MGRYLVRYTYYVDVSAPTDFDAADMADEILDADLKKGVISAIDFVQSEPEETTGLGDEYV